jgi:hypothetical protein
VGADVGDAGFDVLGVVGAEADENVQGVSPVPAGPVVVVEGVVGVGEAVVSAGMIFGLG